MPRELPTQPTQFVFAPALYPKTPLEGSPVFVHGTITEAKQRNGEWIIRGKDEKGEWEAYTEPTPGHVLEIGQRVRGFGIIESQPDGKVVLAARWIKPVEEIEHAFCVDKTQREWATLLARHPKIGELVPYVQPANKPAYAPSPRAPPKQTNTGEFVSALDLKVEQDFV